MSNICPVCYRDRASTPKIVSTKECLRCAYDDTNIRISRLEEALREVYIEHSAGCACRVCLIIRATFTEEKKS
jgi:hypothetical protein